MKAKDLIIDEWLNTNDEFHFDVNGPYIKVIHVFQMLCAGCIYQEIPQAQDLYNTFDSKQVKVIGLHSVFENHKAMEPHALKVFISELRLTFPVAIDKRLDGQRMPETMKSYNLQGTPSLIIIDQQGKVKISHFGLTDQKKVKQIIQQLLTSSG